MNRIATLLSRPKLHEQCQCPECRTIRRNADIEPQAREIDAIIGDVGNVSIPSRELSLETGCGVHLAINGITRPWKPGEDLRQYVVEELLRLASQLTEAAEALGGAR